MITTDKNHVSENLRKMNEGQRKVFEAVMSGRNVLATGPAGTGKSFIIDTLDGARTDFRKRNVIVSPTGIAALNVGGVTAHSFFKLPIGYLDPQARKEHIQKKFPNKFLQDARKLFSSIGTLIIDEGSMLRADSFVAMDETCQHILGNNLPFGGLQVCIFGDFYQLPPVLKSGTDEYQFFTQEFSSPYIFDTNSWKRLNLDIIELTETKRQYDPAFIERLTKIRTKADGWEESVQYWNANNIASSEETMNMTWLCTRNKDADHRNYAKLNELQGESRYFIGEKSGFFDPQNLPTSEILELKIGAKIMACANSRSDDENKTTIFANGEMGTVVSFGPAGEVDVLLDSSNEIVTVKPNRWSNYAYQTKETTDPSTGNTVKRIEKVEVGSYTQLPLKLGWAITMHKAQGLTLDAGVLNTGSGCFEKGQFYVAASRFRDEKQMMLINPIGEHEVLTSLDVARFFQNLSTPNNIDSDFYDPNI